MIESTYSADLCSNAPVLVTGGNGFIAGHVISQLLCRGYRVRCTVRSLEQLRLHDYISTLRTADSNLEIVEADLTVPHSWEKAFEGVEYVFHVASPYTLKPDDPETSLVAPIVHGTQVRHQPPCISSMTYFNLIMFALP